MSCNMLSLINSELPLPQEIPKRKRGRPRKSCNIAPPPIPAPIIPKDTTHLSHAHKIVKAIMDLTRIGPFMERPDDSFFGLHDYYTVITQPIWIREICRKVGNREYCHLKELVNDVELMLENCYRFWGPHHRISRLGFMIENALEKTIKLLPENVRQCVRGPEEHEEEERRKMEAAKRQNRVLGFDPYLGYDPNLMQSQGLMDFDKENIPNNIIAPEIKEPVAGLADESKQMIQFDEDDPQMKRGFESRILSRVLTSGPTRRKIKFPNLENPDELFVWEQETFQPLQTDIDIRSLWQLASIGHFLKVCGPLLDLEELTQIEVERMLLIPKQSFSLALVMTSMLCPRFARSQLFSSPVMCYDVWNKLLRNKLELWYKIYYAHEHPAKVFEKSGVEPNFWAAMGDVNPLWGKDFDELEFFQRVWIMHSLCTYILHSVKSLEEILQGYEGDELRGLCLGRQGKYEYWSMFQPEIRVYRQATSNNEQWNMEMMTADNIPRPTEICEYFSRTFETTGYLPPPWVYPCEKDFKLVAWDEESLENLIQEMKGKTVQTDLIQLKESTEKHREYTLHGLHMLYNHVTNDMNKDSFVVTKSVDYWISKNKGPVITSPSQPKDILFGIGNQGPNLDLLYAIGKRERKRRVPADSVIEEAEAGDGSSGSDWERERTRRSKRIRLSRERKQEEAKRRKQLEYSPLSNMYNNMAQGPRKNLYKGGKKATRKTEVGHVSPFSDASTQSCPSPPFWHPDQEEEAFYRYYHQNQLRQENQGIPQCAIPALADHAINPPMGPDMAEPVPQNQQMLEEIEIGQVDDSQLDGTEPDAVLNRGLRPDGTYGFYLSVGQTIIPLSDEAACRLVLLQEGLES